MVPPNKLSDTTITPDDSVPLYVELLNSTSRPAYVRMYGIKANSNKIIIVCVHHPVMP